MSAAAQSLFGSQPEVADRARMIASVAEMPGELIGVDLCLRAVRYLEFHPNHPMEARPAAGGHTSIHHLSIQRMDETKTRREASIGPLKYTGVTDKCSLAGESRA